MSEIEEIIESGILESYCLGGVSREEEQLVEQYLTKYPEIKKEIDAIRKGIEGYVSAFSLDPPDETRSALLNEIDRLTALSKTPLKLDEFIEINEQSDYKTWIELTKDVIPPKQYEIHLHNIYSDKENFLFVAWVNHAVPVEVHTDIYESFLILEGTCTCLVGDEYIDLKAGDYFPIPLHLPHSLKITSKDPVKAILQRKLSA